MKGVLNMGEERNKQSIISASVPACPFCAGAVKKILIPSGIFYKCPDCECCFTVTEPGQAEHEMLCEEVQYENKT